MLSCIPLMLQGYPWNQLRHPDRLRQGVPAEVGRVEAEGWTGTACRETETVSLLTSALPALDCRYVGLRWYRLSQEYLEEMRLKSVIPHAVSHGVLIQRLPLVTDHLLHSNHILLRHCPYCRVVSDSPAARAGLQAGDIITHINGLPIHGQVCTALHFLCDKVFDTISGTSTNCLRETRI